MSLSVAAATRRWSGEARPCLRARYCRSIMTDPCHKWVRDDGSVVSCTEKVKVMTENLDELRQLAQDALEDGLLLEVSEAQLRDALHKLVDSLVNPYIK